MAAGAAQLHRVYKAIDMTSETFYGRGHTRLKQIEHLIGTGQLDSRLFWAEPVLTPVGVGAGDAVQTM